MEPKAVEFMKQGAKIYYLEHTRQGQVSHGNGTFYIRFLREKKVLQYFS